MTTAEQCSIMGFTHVTIRKGQQKRKPRMSRRPISNSEPTRWRQGIGVHPANRNGLSDTTVPVAVHFHEVLVPAPVRLHDCTVRYLIFQVPALRAPWIRRFFDKRKAETLFSSYKRSGETASPVPNELTALHRGVAY